MPKHLELVLKVAAISDLGGKVFATILLGKVASWEGVWYSAILRLWNWKVLASVCIPTNSNTRTGRFCCLALEKMRFSWKDGHMRRVIVIMLLPFVLVLVHFLVFALFRPNLRGAMRAAQSDSSEGFLPRTATHKHMTFNGDCSSSKLHNKTWARTVAPFVDSVAAKGIVRDMGTSVSLLKTIAIYDADNVSKFTAEAMENLPDSVIKLSPGSVPVAQIIDGNFECFTACAVGNTVWSLKEGNSQREAAAATAREGMLSVLKRDGGKDLETQPQHAMAPRQIIIEERLRIEQFLAVHWWVANGQPLFVFVRCDSGQQQRASYYTSDFRELAIGTMERCPKMTKPKNWDRMNSIVQEMGNHLPGIVCIDLFANERDVYFSEFNFTKDMCSSLMNPAVADALLFHVGNGLVAPHLVTPEYVQRTIEARSWVSVSFNPEEPRLASNEGIVVAARSPSSLDLCLHQNSEQVDSCTERVAPIAPYPLHCVVEKQGSRPTIMSAIGLEKVPTLARILERMDWAWALAVAALAAYLTFSATAKNPEPQRWQVGNWCTYVALMTAYKYQQNHFAGFIAPTPILNTFVQSFEIFKVVHPVTSTAVALSHFASYWCPIAALLVKRRSRMLWFFLCYEVGTAFVNEYTHFEEADDGVRCMRVSYIQHAKQYAFNDVIRVYLLPPFFVYGYLLPKMIRFWAGF